MAAPLVLVTGGAGFIGSNIVADLVARGDVDVAVCDRLREASSGKWRNLAGHAIADFVAPEGLVEWLAGRGRDTEVVFHMGAVSSTVEPDADKIIQTNFGLSRDLFDWCATRRRRFVYASSAAVYGDGGRGFDDDPSPGALTGHRPLNAYGWSKQLFDSYAYRQARRELAPPQWAGLRFFNVYGPNEGHKGVMSSIVTRLWPIIVAGEAVRLFRSHRPDYSDGGQKRDFVYVRDAVQVALWLFDHPQVSGVFNVGSGEARTFLDLAHAAFAAADRPARIEFIDTPVALRGAYQYFTEARLGRLRDAGYPSPFTPIEAGVGDYVDRFLSRTDGYR